MKPHIVNVRMNKLAAKSRMIKFSIFAAVLSAIILMTGGLYFRSSVYITDGGVTKEYKTNETDIYAILFAEDYKLSPDDKVTVTKDENNESHIEIHRAFEVLINADGKTKSVAMTKGTVKDALDAAEITLGKDDIVSFPLDFTLIEGMKIKVTRIEYKERSAEEVKAFEVEYIDNSNLAMGNETVISEGVNGSHIVNYKDLYINGEFYGSFYASETVTEQPVKQVVERGTAFAEPWAKMENPETLKLVNGLPENYVKVISGKATAYSARYGARTASGRYARVGTVAVNPNIIPYGSEVYVVAQDGSRVYGYAIAADTGVGMMEGTVAVDVFCGSYEESCRWGACYVDVYVLSEGDGKYISDPDSEYYLP